ncbi:MAG TPA: hypothetical protein VGF85_01760 [Opitutaceae bacterium]|jgi:hypothetical protein
MAQADSGFPRLAIVRCTVFLAGKPAYTWIDGIVVLCIAFLCAVLWLASIPPLKSEGSWKTPRSWYEAGFALAVLFLSYAAFVLATGRTPSRSNSRPVPRRQAIYWLETAAVPAAIGAVALLLEKRKRAKER